MLSMGFGLPATCRYKEGEGDVWVGEDCGEKAEGGGQDGGRAEVDKQAWKVSSTV